MRTREYPEGLVSYVPFHFPYETDSEIPEGLEDEVSSETWSLEGEDYNYSRGGFSNSSKSGKVYHPFGMRRLYFNYDEGYVIGTNTSGILNMNSSGSYELEICFCLSTVPNDITGYWEYSLDNELKIKLEHENTGEETISDLVLSLGCTKDEKNGGEWYEDGEATYTTRIKLSSPSWGLQREYTQTVKITNEDTNSEADAETGLNEYDRKYASLWNGNFQDDAHLLLRISEQKVKIYINGKEAGSANLPSDVELKPDWIKIGGFIGNIWNYALWHRARTEEPEVPTEIYSATLNVNELGGFGTGADGGLDKVILAKESAATLTDIQEFNCCGLISSVKDERTFEVSSWVGGGSGIYAYQGCEVMIHVTKPRSYVAGEYPYLGMFTFRKAARLKGTKIVLNRSIREATDGFTLNSELVSEYFVQAIIVPNFRTLTLVSQYNINICPVNWKTNECGGIVVFRTTGDCTLRRKIQTISNSPFTGYGGIRAYDSHQLTHHSLVNRFLCSGGGGVMIFCGGKLTMTDACRIGTPWAGNEFNSNYRGPAGYGGGQYASNGYGRGGTEPGKDLVTKAETASNHSNFTTGGACVFIVARAATINESVISTGASKNSQNNGAGCGFCYMAIGELVDG